MLAACGMSNAARADLHCAVDALDMLANSPLLCFRADTRRGWQSNCQGHEAQQLLGHTKPVSN